MDTPQTLHALLRQQGITSYRDLMPLLECSKQQAHMYWYGYRCRRDPNTGAQVRIAVPLGLKVATRLAVRLGLPLANLLSVVPASAAPQGQPWGHWSRAKYRRLHARSA